MLEKIKNTSEYLQKITRHFKPEIGIVLGSGLGNFSDEIESKTTIDYHDIPGFPVSTVEGHSGKLLLGQVGGKNIIALQGRFHYYEGYTMQELTFPIRVMIDLGIKHLFLSNASGGINPSFQVGDLMIINDHINLFFNNPLMGKNYSELGPRFLDMSQPYNLTLVDQAMKIAQDNQIKIFSGVYAAVSGPCFETRAELKFLKIIGTDAIGMSTIPEVIVAKHAGISCFAISIITDIGVIDKPVTISHQEVLEAANKSAPKMNLIFKELIKKIEIIK